MNEPEEQSDPRNPSGQLQHGKSKLLHVMMQRAMKKGAATPENAERLWPGDN